MDDTKIGSAIVDAGINTDGVKKGSEEIKRDFEGIAEAATKTVDTVNKEFDNFDPSQAGELTKRTAEVMRDSLSGVAEDVADALDELPESYKTIYDKISKIRDDDTLDEEKRAEKIQELYEILGQDQEEAFKNAWYAIGYHSDAGAQEVVNNLKKIAREAKETADEMEDAMQDAASATSEAAAVAAGGAAGFMSSIVAGGTEAIANKALEWLEEAAEAIIEFGKQSIELGSDLQEVQNVVDVTFSTMSEKVNDFARDAATSAGLSETMAKKYVGTFGAMADSFGFTEQKAYEMSTTLTQLTGDVASFYNLDHDEAYTKLKSVFTGETESLKDLGVVMTQTALDDYAMRKGFQKTTAQMSEQEKVALRYEFVLEQLSGASGDFARTQESWANQTRILSLQWESLQATVGQGLINAFTPAIKFINKTVMPALQDVADEFAEAFDPTPAETFREQIEQLEEAFESTEEQLEKTSSEIFVNAAMAEACVAQLEELAEAGLDTAESQLQYELAVKRLQELMPNLNLTINEQTGLLEQNTDAIRDEIAAMKDYAIEQAQMEAVKSYYDAYYDAVKAVYDAQYDLMVLENEMEGIYAQLAESLGMTVDQVKALEPAVTQAGVVLVDQAGRVYHLTDRGKELTESLIDNINAQTSLTSAIEDGNEIMAERQARADGFAEKMYKEAENTRDAADAQNELTTATEANISVLDQAYQKHKEVNGITDEAKQSADALTQSNENAAVSQETVSQEVAETAGDVQSLGTAYTETGTAAQTSSGQQVQAFDAVAQESNVTTDTILKNAKAIPEEYQKVTNTIKTQFSEFNTTFLESAKMFAEATDEELEKLLKIAGEFEEVAEEFMESYEDMETDAIKMLENIEKKFGTSFDRIERDVNASVGTIQGYINSIQGKTVTINVVTKYSTIGTPSGTLGGSGSYLYSAAPAAYTAAATPAYSVPYLAEGAVIPPRAPFMAVLGDQRSGYNIEAPAELIRSIVREEVESSAGNEELVDLMQTLIGVVQSISIGDDTIAQAANRYNQKMAIVKGIKQ